MSPESQTAVSGVSGASSRKATLPPHIEIGRPTPLESNGFRVLLFNS